MVLAVPSWSLKHTQRSIPAFCWEKHHSCHDLPAGRQRVWSKLDEAVENLLHNLAREAGTTGRECSPSLAFELRHQPDALENYSYLSSSLSGTFSRKKNKKIPRRPGLGKCFLVLL